ncbi:MAG: hypothetical protein ACRC6V_01085 [Bacteroidales bacterium]
MNSMYRKGLARGREELAEEVLRIAGNEELTNDEILKLIITEVNKSEQFCGYTSVRGY